MLKTALWRYLSWGGNSVINTISPQSRCFNTSLTKLSIKEEDHVWPDGVKYHGFSYYPR